MNNEIYQLFVYGSLRSGFQSTAYEYLSKYFHLIGEAVVKGKLYDAGSYPVAVATDEDSTLQGELYCINNPAEFSWAMGQLDDYEGLNVESGETPLYKRRLVTAFINGDSTMAWVYWFNGPVHTMPELPISDTLQYPQQKTKI
jgi:gamma-glutamylcyclotransferase (GGCT)/AIG2-like uncharacterized protein YtfP